MDATKTRVMNETTERNGRYDAVGRCVLRGDLAADAKEVLRWLRAVCVTHDDEPELVGVSTNAQELIGRMARRIAELEGN